MDQGGVEPGESREKGPSGPDIQQGELARTSFRGESDGKRQHNFRIL